MDGYLSKPIRPLELDAVLDGSISSVSEPTVSRRTLERHAGDTIHEAELFDRIGGDLAFLAELTEVFRSGYPKGLSNARQALEEKNSEEVMRAAHGLKGGLLNYWLRARELNDTDNLVTAMGI
jgi:hypothetical protein